MEVYWVQYYISRKNIKEKQNIKKKAVISSNKSLSKLLIKHFLQFKQCHNVQYMQYITIFG